LLALISPAKRLVFPRAPLPASTPIFTDATQELVTTCASLSSTDLTKLMKISDKIATMNVERYDQLANDNASLYPASMMFDGEVYRGLEASTMSATALVWSQNHLAILSGLYGLLRPLDAVAPYRLEMGSRLKTEQGNTLYDFWGEQIADRINEILSGHKEKVVVNLASKEYTKSISMKSLKAEFVECKFMEERDGKLKILSVYAKKARGLMARYMMDNQIETVDELKGFNVDGYSYQPEQSSDGVLVFAR
jgi:cytoplasmic iron level regulating protein YaaA (DUF328/UPF0246 family)